jgi:hypothetical protein
MHLPSLACFTLSNPIISNIFEDVANIYIYIFYFFFANKNKINICALKIHIILVSIHYI